MPCLHTYVDANALPDGPDKSAFSRCKTNALFSLNVSSPLCESSYLPAVLSALLIRLRVDYLATTQA